MLKTLFTKKDGDIKMKTPNKNNALDKFYNTLSSEIKEKEVSSWSDENIYGLIRAKYFLQTEVIDDLAECMAQSLKVLAKASYEKKKDVFSLAVSFNSTIDGGDTELFAFILHDVNVPIYDIKENFNINDEDFDNNYETKKRPENLKRSLLIDEKEKVLAIYKEVKEHFQDNDGKSATLWTSNVLMALEFMSTMQYEESEAMLEGLIIKDKVINKNYKCSLYRMDVVQEVRNNYSRTKRCH